MRFTSNPVQTLIMNRFCQEEHVSILKADWVKRRVTLITSEKCEKLWWQSPTRKWQRLSLLLLCRLEGHQWSSPRFFGSTSSATLIINSVTLRPLIIPLSVYSWELHYGTANDSLERKKKGKKYWRRRQEGLEWVDGAGSTIKIYLKPGIFKKINITGIRIFF